MNGRARAPLLLARGEVDRPIAPLTAGGRRRRKSQTASPGSLGERSRAVRGQKGRRTVGLAALHRAKNLAPGHVPTLMKLAELYTRETANWARPSTGLEPK